MNVPQAIKLHLPHTVLFRTNTFFLGVQHIIAALITIFLMGFVNMGNIEGAHHFFDERQWMYYAAYILMMLSALKCTITYLKANWIYVNKLGIDHTNKVPDNVAPDGMSDNPFDPTVQPPAGPNMSAFDNTSNPFVQYQPPQNFPNQNNVR